VATCIRATLALIVLAALAGPAASSGIDGYYVPGVETGDILMSVHVWGEVASPGTQLVPAGCDLIGALSAAGGPTSDANMGRIRIIIDGAETIYDLDSFLSGTGEPVPELTPGATVFVPESHSGWWKDALNVAYTVLVTANLVWIMTTR
jgi:hypothetical protein